MNNSILKGRKKILFWSFFVIPVFIYGLFFIGLRPLDAGSDTPNYVKAYLELDGFFTARAVGMNNYGNTELLWWPLQSLVRIFLEPQGWLVFNYLITFFSVYFSYKVLCKKTKINTLFFIFVFLTYYSVYTGNTIRQSLALPFGLMAFCFLFDKSIFISAVLVVFSIGLHWSSLFFLLSPIMFFSFFKKKYFCLIVPIVCLLFSVFIDDVMRIAINVIPVSELRVKYDLYFAGGRESHIDVVWKTFNFWLCVVVSFLFLIVCNPERYRERVLYSYVLLFLSLILFGVHIPDFSERFFPAILLVMPLMLALLMRRLKLPASVAGFSYLLFFILMGVLVFLNPSAQETLGYTFSLH